MKKRICPKILLIVLAILVVCAAALIALGNYLSHRGYGATVGRCLVTKEGSYMLIGGNYPIVLSDRSKGKDLFTSLESGDKILVVHDGICESYPSQTGAYACIRLERGDIGDIPEAVLQNLAQLGWIDGGRLAGRWGPTAVSAIFPPSISVPTATGMEQNFRLSESSAPRRS